MSHEQNPFAFVPSRSDRATTIICVAIIIACVATILVLAHGVFQ